MRTKLITLLCHLSSLLFHFLPRSPLPSEPSSILILKPCCLGDVLMATAVLAPLRSLFPKARIAFAVGPWAREVIANNPRLDKVIDCGQVGSGAPYSVWEYLALVRRLRRGRYQLCLILDRSPLLNLLPFLAGIPHRAGIDSQGRGFALTLKVAPKPKQHEAELYLAVVQALGAGAVAPRTEFFPTREDEKWAELALKDGGGSRGIIAIHPGGGANPGMNLPAKRWRAERLATVAERLLARSFGVVVVGGAEDLGASQELRASLGLDPLPAHWIDLTGKTSLGQLGALLRHCRLFLGHDSGPMHLAVAMGTPVLALFGPSDPITYGPLGERSLALYKGVECSPCFLGGRWHSACSEYKCIDGITVEEVWGALEGLLQAREPAATPPEP